MLQVSCITIVFGGKLKPLYILLLNVSTALLTLLMMTAESLLSKCPILLLQFYFFSLIYFCPIFIVFQHSFLYFIHLRQYPPSCR